MSSSNSRNVTFLILLILVITTIFTYSMIHPNVGVNTNNNQYNESE